MGCRLWGRTETQLKRLSSSNSNTFTEHLQGALSYACELPQGRSRPAPGPLELTDLSPNLFTYLCQPSWLGYDSRDLGQPSSLVYLVHHWWSITICWLNKQMFLCFIRVHRINILNSCHWGQVNSFTIKMRQARNLTWWPLATGDSWAPPCG